MLFCILGYNSTHTRDRRPAQPASPQTLYGALSYFFALSLLFLSYFSFLVFLVYFFGVFPVTWEKRDLTDADKGRGTVESQRLTMLENA